MKAVAATIIEDTNEGDALPKGWRWARLGDVCEFTYGSGLPERSRIKGDVPVYGSNGIVGSHNEALTKGSVIIVGRKGSVGEVHLSNGPCWAIDTTYFIVEVPEKYHLEWLFFALKWLDLGRLDKSTAIPGLAREDAYDRLLPLPPVAEQQRIAAKLREKMEVVARAKKAAEEQLENISRLPASVLRQAFIGEL